MFWIALVIVLVVWFIGHTWHQRMLAEGKMKRWRPIKGSRADYYAGRVPPGWVPRNRPKPTPVIRQHRRPAKTKPQLVPLDGAEFEQQIATLLETLGYMEVHVLGRAGDQGVDIVAADPMGKRTAVQCKAWRHNVGSIEVQKLAGARATMEAHRAILAAMGGYTREATVLAAKAGVELWDGGTVLGLAERGKAILRERG